MLNPRPEFPNNNVGGYFFYGHNQKLFPQFPEPKTEAKLRFQVAVLLRPGPGQRMAGILRPAQLSSSYWILRTKCKRRVTISWAKEEFSRRNYEIQEENPGWENKCLQDIFAIIIKIVRWGLKPKEYGPSFLPNPKIRVF